MAQIAGISNMTDQALWPSTDHATARGVEISHGKPLEVVRIVEHGQCHITLVKQRDAPGLHWFGETNWHRNRRLPA